MPTTPKPELPWWEVMWNTAREHRRESTWHHLPGDIAERMEAGAEMSEAGIAFFAERARDRSGTRLEARMAYATLAAICEDYPQWIPAATPALRYGLQESDAGLRVAAAEAIWQIPHRELLPDLKTALAAEDHASVRLTLEHVIRLFSP